MLKAHRAAPLLCAAVVALVQAAHAPVLAPAASLRVLVSIEQRRLWLVQGADTLMSAPVAVGTARDFSYEGRRFNFSTPRGRRRIRAKEENPVWTPPDWHYFEKAVDLGLTPVVLREGDVVELSDGTAVHVRDGVVGRINQFGNFWPWTPGMEMVFDGMIFIPPLRSPQRRVPDALGPRKLDMGDGYLIHGTNPYTEGSVGRAVSHGCVRMRNEDLLELYDRVPVGTRVVIF